jgi:hypothetical protein
MQNKSRYGRGGFAKLPERSLNKWRDVPVAQTRRYQYRGAKPALTLCSLISLADLYPDFEEAVCHSHQEIRRHVFRT